MYTPLGEIYELNGGVWRPARRYIIRRDVWRAEAF